MNAQPVVTEWVCVKVQHRCERMVGNVKNVVIIDEGNPDEAFVFAFPDMDTNKMSSTESVIGTSVLLGWPRWFPVFFKSRVYQFSYPAKVKL